MTKCLLILIALSSCLLAGPVLRVSKVAAKKGPNTEAMTYTYTTQGGEEHEETLWVEKAVIVSEAEIQEASEGFGNQRNILIELNKAGVKKIGEATKDMKPGFDRLALIVDGKIKSAPVVMGELGASIMISGLESYDDRQFQDLLKRLNGEPAAEK